MSNPLDPSESLKEPSGGEQSIANPQARILPGDSSTTKAEKIERHGFAGNDANEDESPKKRMKRDPEVDQNGTPNAADVNGQTARQKGVAPIKKEYLIDVSDREPQIAHFDDDAAENSGKAAPEISGGRGGARSKGGRDGRKKQGGQNHGRRFANTRDAIELCKSVATINEFTPPACPYGEKCRLEHSIRKYLKDGKREDLQTFNGTCPVWEAQGKCPVGWRCRFASSHSTEVEREDGQKELILLEKGKPVDSQINANGDDSRDDNVGVVNVVSQADKLLLRQKKHSTPQSDQYIQWLNKQYAGDDQKREREKDTSAAEGSQDNRAQFVDPPLLPSEKRRIYYGPETPVLAPLTTQGNLPFRRLCVELGAQVTWSEMAMGLPLLQGERSEWALMKAHESELTSPAFAPKAAVQGYDNSKDIRYGAQIAANKPWLAVKTTEVLKNLCPHLRAIDLNCGCPIDLVFRQGAGSALLDAPGRLEKVLRGMNTVSGEIPITVKIRMGTKDKQPTAEKLCHRLMLGGPDAQEYGEKPSGVAAITLHGRSRQQRYSRSADWEYIAECASLVKKLKAGRAEVTDTIRQPDPRDLPASQEGLPYFCGNGDVLSHVDYETHMQNAGVDTCMIGRGALVKPWVFEEISTGQYLDKSASERLGYIERFARNGLEYWGSDELGVGTTRRFLLEWLSFSCRYVPLGLLEYLPPKFGDRPPAFRGRNEMETLLSSANYKDWIKISEMFLGPTHKDFHFQPKHKSNSYEIEAEG